MCILKEKLEALEDRPMYETSEEEHRVLSALTENLGNFAIGDSERALQDEDACKHYVL